MPKKDYKAGETFSSFHKLIKNNTSLILPFLIVALLDAVALALIFFAPRPPIASFLAPPIRKFWGDQFLHYPQNFVLIPKLFNYAHILTSFTFGIIMTGIFIKMSQSYLERRRHVLKKNVLLPAVVATFKKYVPMFIFF